MVLGLVGCGKNKIDDAKELQIVQFQYGYLAGEELGKEYVIRVKNYYREYVYGRKTCEEFFDLVEGLEEEKKSREAQ